MTDLLPFAETGEASLTHEQYVTQALLLSQVRKASPLESVRFELLVQLAGTYWHRHPAEMPEGVDDGEV